MSSTTTTTTATISSKKSKIQIKQMRKTNKLNAIKNAISSPTGVNITPEFDTKIIKMEKTKMQCNYLISRR